MRLLCFYILLLLCSCGQTNNTTVLTDNEIAGDVLAPPTSDTLVQYVFKNGLKGNQLLKINPNIEFSSGDTNGVSFYKYRFEYEGLSYEFLAEHKERADRSVYINKEKAKIYRKNSKEFNVDSMEMHIDYTESDIYVFKNNPSYLLVVSHPMNWVGLMTRFSFFQLIDMKERNVVEFIREGE